MKQDNCIFCKIIAGEIPSHIIYEDEKFKVMLDIGAMTKGHALIVPKEHYANLYEMPEEMVGDAFKLAQKMVKHMTKVLNCDGFNVMQNNGECAGQTVFHFHIHLIPRYKTDEEVIRLAKGEPTQEELAKLEKLLSE